MEIKLKLMYHPRVDTKGRTADDVILSVRDNHGINPGDIIDVFHIDEQNHALFLVGILRDDFQQKDAISIEQTLAQSRKLQLYKTVCVRVVNKKDVLLDLVEVNFRDQYLSRRDLIEFSKHLTNSIVQLNKKLDFGAMRGYISELWRKGEPLSCGYVSNLTKVVYRSSSAVLHIFVQMSNEMWNFDEFGDLYFEKGVKFLRELFLKSWIESNSNHDVTIIFFTRVYIDLLFSELRSYEFLSKTVICRNSNGHFYVDFYKVLIQNERFTPDEWRRTLTQMLLEFKEYQYELKQYVLSQLSSVNNPQDVSIRISSSRDGNILEALNLTITLYEGYNIDRNFDRTGKGCIIITPGSGVFDVNRELTSMTKQRTLDLGIIMDLVCLGKQPLHAVPLFVCRANDGIAKADFENECYIVPHWMNHSFFRSSREISALKNGEPVSRINVKARQSFGPRRTDQLLVQMKSALNPYVYIESLGIQNPSNCLPLSMHTQATNTKPNVRQRTISFRLDSQSNSHLQLPHQLATSWGGGGLKINRIGILSSSNQSGVRSISRETISYFRENSLTSDTCESGKSGGLCGQVDSDDSFGSTPSAKSWSIVNRREIKDKGSGVSCHGLQKIGTKIPPQLFSVGTDWMSLYGYPGPELQQPFNQYLTNRLPSVTVSRGITMDMTTLVQFEKYSNAIRKGNEQESNSDINSWVQPSSIVAGGDSLMSYQSRYIRAPFRLPGPMAAGQPKRKPMTPNHCHGNSTSFKTFPFGIHPKLFGFRRSAGQRRWAHFHTVAYQSHQNAFDKSQCMLILEGVKPRLNLSKVWRAYFAFHRYVLLSRLRNGASGRNSDASKMPGCNFSESQTRLQTVRQNSSHNMLIANNKGFILGDDATGLNQHRRTIYFAPVTYLPSSGRKSSSSRPRVDGVQNTSLKPKVNSSAGRSLMGSEASLSTIEFADDAAWLVLLDAASSANRSILKEAFNSAARKNSLCEQHKNTSFSYEILCSTAGNPTLEHHQCLLREMLKPISVDWKSLTAPAVLPLTTDFFPEAANLRGDDYLVHDYRVVPSSIKIEEWQKLIDFVTLPGSFYSRRPLTALEVLEEVVNQRINQGFQLCVEGISMASSVADSQTPDCPSQDSIMPLRSNLSSVQEADVSSSLIKPLEKVLFQRKLSASTEHKMKIIQKSTTSTDQKQKISAEVSSVATVTPTRTSYRSRGQPPRSITRLTQGRGLMLGNRFGTVGNTPADLSISTAEKGGGSTRVRVNSQTLSHPPASPSIPPAGGRGVSPEPLTFRLSMGSLFYSLTLESDETIAVTKYQARQNQKIDNVTISYRYALQVPDSLTYYPLEIKFVNRLASAFNWSYLDNLVATHGVNESYGLVSALKFWRSRFILLPAFASTTKRLWEALKEGKSQGKQVMCDIYEPPLAVHNYGKLCDKFVSFIESVNRIRRTPQPSHKPKQLFPIRRQMSVDEHFMDKSELPRVRHDSASAVSVQTMEQGTIATSTSNHPSRLHRLLGTLAGTGSTTPDSVPLCTSTDSVVMAGDHTASTVGFRSTTPPLPPSTSSASSIISPSTALLSSVCEMERVMFAIIDPEFGLPFVTASIAFPKYTFCAYDLTQWLRKHLTDIRSTNSAVNYAQTILDAGLICHASGNPKHRFIHGFYLYTILVEFSSTASVAESLESPAPKSLKMTTGSIAQVSSLTVASNSNSTTSNSSSGRRSIVVDPSSNSTLTSFPVMHIIPFPQNYLPQTNHHSLGSFTTEFQKEWTEVAIVRSVPDSFLRFPNLTLPPISLPTSPPNCGSSFGSCKNPSKEDADEALSDKDEQINETLNGIFCLNSLGHVFGANTNPNVHVGSEGVLRKRITRDLQDSATSISHHVEWYCFLYDMNYHPACAYSMEIQWLVASGSRIGENVLLYIYHQATNKGFHFVPTPCYPFGYSGTRFAMDPLRIPIFVACNFNCLLEKANDGEVKGIRSLSPYEVASQLFPELLEDDQMSGLFYFQDLILGRFGFIPLAYSPPVKQMKKFKKNKSEKWKTGNDDDDDIDVKKDTINDRHSSTHLPPAADYPKGMAYTQRMYAHCSGGMFAMIPVYSTSPPPTPPTLIRRQDNETLDPENVPLEILKESTCSPSTCSYTTTLESGNENLVMSRNASFMEKLIGGQSRPSFLSHSTTSPPRSVDPQTSCFECQHQIGFFWTWNYMLPWKFRNQFTLEERFRSGLLMKLDGEVANLANAQEKNLSVASSGPVILEPQVSCFEAQSRVGFFWTWNYMLPRKWRGQLTGDEAFQDGMLEDFRAFCYNADHRLMDMLTNYKAFYL